MKQDVVNKEIDCKKTITGFSNLHIKVKETALDAFNAFFSEYLLVFSICLKNIT